MLWKPTEKDKKALNYVLGGKKYKILLSFWHIVEATGLTDKEAIDLGKFIESLEAHWLRDRVNIQNDEVKSGFFRQQRYQYGRNSPVEAIRSSFLQLVADIVDIPCMYHTPLYFIRGWKQNPSLMKPINDVRGGRYIDVWNDIQTAQAGRKRIRDVDKTEIVRRYISQRLPIRDPQGRFIHPTEKDNFIRQLDLQDLVKYPSINTEFLFAEFKMLDPRRRPKETDSADCQHLIPALTYADAFVTRDGYLRDGAKYVKKKTRVPLAEIYGSLASFVEAE